MTFMTFMTFMTHGNVIFDILEARAFRKIAHVGTYKKLTRNFKNFVALFQIKKQDQIWIERSAR